MNPRARRVVRTCASASLVCSSPPATTTTCFRSTSCRSGDFTLDAKVVGTLAPLAKDIELRGCVRFGPTVALRERDPRMHAIVATTGAPMVEGERETFSIEIDGTLGNMRRLGRVCALEQVR